MDGVLWDYDEWFMGDYGWTLISWVGDDRASRWDEQ